jgi:hypothetical protein
VRVDTIQCTARQRDELHDHCERHGDQREVDAAQVVAARDPRTDAQREQ